VKKKARRPRVSFIYAGACGCTRQPFAFDHAMDHAAADAMPMNAPSVSPEVMTPVALFNPQMLLLASLGFVTIIVARTCPQAWVHECAAE
jgi:hypothetical protein